MSALDLIAARADHGEPVTALAFYACNKGCPPRQIREYYPQTRPLVTSAKRCSCGGERIYIEDTREPENPEIGRAEIRRVLTDMGIEPEGI